MRQQSAAEKWAPGDALRLSKGRHTVSASIDEQNFSTHPAISSNQAVDTTDPSFLRCMGLRRLVLLMQHMTRPSPCPLPHPDLRLQYRSADESAMVSFHARLNPNAATECSYAEAHNNAVFCRSLAVGVLACQCC